MNTTVILEFKTDYCDFLYMRNLSNTEIIRETVKEDFDEKDQRITNFVNGANYLMYCIN